MIDYIYTKEEAETIVYNTGYHFNSENWYQHKILIPFTLDLIHSTENICSTMGSSALRFLYQRNNHIPIPAASILGITMYYRFYNYKYKLYRIDTRLGGLFPDDRTKKIIKLYWKLSDYCKEHKISMTELPFALTDDLNDIIDEIDVDDDNVIEMYLMLYTNYNLF